METWLYGPTALVITKLAKYVTKYLRSFWMDGHALKNEVQGEGARL